MCSELELGEQSANRRKRRMEKELRTKYLKQLLQNKTVLKQEVNIVFSRVGMLILV